MNTTVSKNSSIEFFRFLFMCVIVLWHFHNIVPLFKCGDFAVDFFFILSGCMIYRSFLIRPDTDAIQFTFRRIKRIYLEWIIVLIPVFFIKFRDFIFIGKSLNTSNLYKYFLRLFHESLFLSQNGLFTGSSNYASWFICVLIVGGGILYSVNYHYPEKAPGLFFPIFSLFSLVYFYSINPNEIWSIRGCFDLQFLRGCAEMCLGMTLYYFAEKYQSDLCKHHSIVDFFSILSLILFISLLFASREFANYSPLCCCMFLLGSLTDNSLMSRCIKGEVWVKLGGITFEMLLIHGLVKPFVSFIGIGRLPAVLSITVYLVLVIMAAIALKWLNKAILKRI